MHRRRFLGLGLAGAAYLALPRAARASAPEKSLSFVNLHTGESLRRVPFWAEGRYVPESLAELNRLLRDHRTGDVAAIDPQLFDLLFSLDHALGTGRPFQVISGYRSPATNAMLHATHDGVASGSLHTHGKAIDIRIAGVALADLHRAALGLQRGGVGYYPASDFVHVDTGRVRRW